MEITCFGCRGSHAVSGNGFTRFGGHTTSFLVTFSDCETVFFIDAGSGICNAVLPETIRKAHLLFTHTPLDHIVGFPFLPALRRCGFELTVCGPVARHGASIKDVMTTLFAPAFFPVSWNGVHSSVSFADKHDGDCFYVDGSTVDCFCLPHSSATLGYRLRYRNRTAVFCFDAELEALDSRQTEQIGRLLEGTDLLIADATYTSRQYSDGRRGFGHSAMETVAAFAERYGICRTGLTHHSPEADDDILTQHEKRLQNAFPSANLFFLREGMKISLI